MLPAVSVPGALANGPSPPLAMVSHEQLELSDVHLSCCSSHVPVVKPQYQPATSADQEAVQLPVAELELHVLPEGYTFGAVPVSIAEQFDTAGPPWNRASRYGIA